MADRIPLAEQLDELAAEYTRRCRAYPILVARGQMRQAAMEMKIERMAAAHNTLAWIFKNSESIKEWVTMSVKFRGYEGRGDVNETIMDAPPDVLPPLDELTWEEVGDEGGEEKGPEEEAAE